MKLFKKLIALIMVVVLMAGCTLKSNAGFKISEDGNLSISMILAMDNDMIDTILTIYEDKELQASIQAQGDDFDPSTIKAKAHTDSERWAFIEDKEMGGELFDSFGEDMEGFTKTKYDQNGFKGYIYTREVGSLDNNTKESADDRVDISEVINDDYELEDEILFTKSGDVYKSNMKIVSESDDDMSEIIDQVKEYGGKLDLFFIVDLPTKAISSNAEATENDGKTLKWSLYSNKNLDFEFKLKEDKKDTVADEKDEKKSSDSEEKSNLLLYIGIGVGALLLLVIIIAVIASSKKKNVVQQQPVAGPAVMSPTYGPTVQPLDPVQPAEPPVQPVEPPVQPVEPPVQPVQPPVDTQDPNNNQQM